MTIRRANFTPSFSEPLSSFRSPVSRVGCSLHLLTKILTVSLITNHVGVLCNIPTPFSIPPSQSASSVLCFVFFLFFSPFFYFFALVPFLSSSFLLHVVVTPVCGTRFTPLPKVLYHAALQFFSYFSPLDSPFRDVSRPASFSSS